MIAFDTMKLGIDAIDLSIFASPTPDRDSGDAMATRLPRRTSGDARTEGALRDAFERDDRQVLAAGMVLNAQLDHGAGSSPNERVWLRARRPSRPTSPRLESRPPASRE